MNCPLCGEVCRCPSEPLPSVSLQGRPIPESEFASSSIVSARFTSTGAELTPMLAVESATTSGVPTDSRPPIPDVAAWRGELSDRLNRYRSRRKVRPPRYPSLSLQFDPADGSANARIASSPAEFEPVSSNALALDGMRHEPAAATAVQVSRTPAPETAPPTHPPEPHAGAKIIAFPRLAWGPPPPPPDQLAEPVSERPRILDVPDAAPPPPALGGITIEGVEHQEAERRPGIDIPLRSAPLGLRLVAVLVDGLIIVLASALFGFIFWEIVGVRPPLAQIVGLAVGIPCLFWAAYQYLLIVYAASTPGLRIVGLQLARFDGSSVSRRLRRWRALAGCLSGVSAGMGYAWVFLDEDSLCWHDRITRTYLAPKKRAAATSSRPQ